MLFYYFNPLFCNNYNCIILRSFDYQPINSVNIPTVEFSITYVAKSTTRLYHLIKSPTISTIDTNLILIHFFYFNAITILQNHSRKPQHTAYLTQRRPPYMSHRKIKILHSTLLQYLSFCGRRWCCYVQKLSKHLLNAMAIACT